MQRSRALMLVQALRFCNELQGLMNKIEVGNRLSAVELEKHIVPLAKFKKEVFEAGLVLHTAIDAETARIGPIIAKLEQGLLAEQS